MQQEFIFEEVTRNVDKLKHLFKRVEIIKTRFESMYDDIWQYKDVNVVFHRKNWGATTDILKKDKIVETISNPLETTNEQLATILLKYVDI